MIISCSELSDVSKVLEYVCIGFPCYQIGCKTINIKWNLKVEMMCSKIHIAQLIGTWVIGSWLIPLQDPCGFLAVSKPSRTTSGTLQVPQGLHFPQYQVARCLVPTAPGHSRWVLSRLNSTKMSYTFSSSNAASGSSSLVSPQSNSITHRAKNFILLIKISCMKFKPHYISSTDRLN